MDVKQAIAVMKSDTNDLKLIRDAADVLTAAGYCPDCLCKSLGDFDEGDYYHNAGRECRECGEFQVCGMQPEFADSPDCHSDADSGL